MISSVWHIPESIPTGRVPLYPRRQDESVDIRVGTWPLEMGQSVWITYQQFDRDGNIILDPRSRVIIPDSEANPVYYEECNWQYNEGSDSYWIGRIGPFDAQAAKVVYNVYARQGRTVLTPPSPDLYAFEFSKDIGELAAPDGPGKPPLWTTGAKTGVGTAVGTDSKVWFCHSRGIINEIYYPKLDIPNVRDFQFLVLDNERKFNNPQQMDSKVEYLDTLQPGGDGIPRSLAYRITNYDTSSLPGSAARNRYELSTDVVAHPTEDAVLVNMRYRALAADAASYRVFGLLATHMSNSGANDSCKLVEHRGQRMYVAWDKGIYCAVASNRRWPKYTCGYVGTSDGWKILVKDGDIGSQQMYTSATDGNVAITFELELPANDPTALVVMAFGTTEYEALERAYRCAACSFDAVANQYMDGWKTYITSLETRRLVAGRKAGNLKAITQGFDSATVNLAYVSAMVVKACQDKKFTGAGVASISVPWGDCIGDSNAGGYHLVWARDLYHASTAAMAVGDYETAVNALRYLDRIQQESDGSMPQNTWLNGTPYWGGEQLDETAMAILLAWRLVHDPGAGLAGIEDFYNSLVRDAADFLARRQNSFTQDRWEEKWGLSPNTIASVVSALLIAAAWADEKNDATRANGYREKAVSILENDLPRCWVNQGGKQFYARLDTIPHVIDGGFLELVRMGVKAATSPNIASSLAVVDQAIRIDINGKAYFYRYGRIDGQTGDGTDVYGDRDDGSGWTGDNCGGRGRRWPLLTGERGHFELARGNIGEASRCLEAMVETANQGLMLAEQIWDAMPIPAKYMVQGKGTGSATPLAWTHAEFLKLLCSVADGRVYDKLDLVTDFMTQHHANLHNQ